MALLYLLIFLTNLVLIQSRTEVERLTFPPNNYTHLDISANALGKAHYNPWTCAYSSEPGYRCLSCSAALHCYPTNFALLVQCAGFFPYCRNGYCSRWKTDGCNEDYTFAEGTHGPLRVTTETNDNTTVSTEENALTTEQVSDENTPTTTAKMDVLNNNNDKEMVLSSDVDDVEKPKS